MGNIQGCVEGLNLAQTSLPCSAWKKRTFSKWISDDVMTRMTRIISSIIENNWKVWNWFCSENCSQRKLDKIEIKIFYMQYDACFAGDWSQSVWKLCIRCCPCVRSRTRQTPLGRSLRARISSHGQNRRVSNEFKTISDYFYNCFSFIIIILMSIFFQDWSRVWTAVSQQHKVDDQPLAT